MFIFSDCKILTSKVVILRSSGFKPVFFAERHHTSGDDHHADDDGYAYLPASLGLVTALPVRLPL